MPCFHPITAYKPSVERVAKTDDKKLIFNPSRAWDCEEIEIACGQCVGCRLERSRQWAIRCMHEAQMHSENSFITLTFSPEALEKRNNEWSLDVRDWQLFMKRLKKNAGGKKIRFFHCGEYGEKNKRPHYHACLFGHDFKDKEIWKETPTGHKLYTSKELEKAWPYGFATIGDVTFESAAYVARYIMKKITGDDAEEHYQWIDDVTGEIKNLKPEYTTMSRKPGIANEWYNQYKDDVYPHDFVVVNGVKMKPPKYYDGLLQTDRPYEFDDIKYQRQLNGEKHVDNNTKDRLNTREQCQLARLNLLPRDAV